MAGVSTAGSPRPVLSGASLRGGRPGRCFVGSLGAGVIAVVLLLVVGLGGRGRVVERLLAGGSSQYWSSASSSLSLSLSASACVKSPLVLVYNRIPKAGSSTLMALFKELSGELGYRYVTPEPYHDHEKLRRVIFRAIEDGERTVIVNHFWYPEIRYGEMTGGWNGSSEVVAYMNVVREPADRAVSDYYYLRHGSDRNPRARAAYVEEHGDLPMEACYFGDVASCRVARDVQADYFCGREGHPCHDEANYQLKERLALANMDAFYTVGVNERFEETVRMLEGTYPAFFAGLVDKYRDGGHANRNANRGNASAALLAGLRRDNAIDGELWRRANARLDAWMGACG